MDFNNGFITLRSCGGIRASEVRNAEKRSAELRHTTKASLTQSYSSGCDSKPVSKHSVFGHGRYVLGDMYMHMLVYSWVSLQDLSRGHTEAQQFTELCCDKTTHSEIKNVILQ